MRYRPLGGTGMKVSELALGGVNFGRWGESDQGAVTRLLHHALDAGINFIDTSDAYSLGESEQLIGKALAGGQRDHMILASKFHLPGDVAWDGAGGDPNMRGNGRRWIVRAVERSLQRLQTDWIDLYQVHKPEPSTDIEETLWALTDLRTQGKIRAFGTSNFAAHELVEAQWASERRALGRFVSEQAPYSMVVRGIEEHVIPVAERHSLALLTWSPLAGGWLSGGWRADREPPPSSRAALLPDRYDLSVPENKAKLAAVEALSGLAESAGLTLVELAIGFVLAQPAVTVPIIGPRTTEQLSSLLGCMEVRLDGAILARIDEIVPPGTTLVKTDME